MKVLITGANGFIGKNLTQALSRDPQFDIIGFDTQHSDTELIHFLQEADIIFHLAGVNRPQTEDEFFAGNVDLTSRICDQLLAEKRSTPLILSSSIQVERDNPYGISKRQAEEVVAAYSAASGAYTVIYRLPNVFGKWCRPNYNSVVATFCHNIAHDLPITISNRRYELSLVHVDDVAAAFVSEAAKLPASGLHYGEVNPVHTMTLGDLADTIVAFRQSRQSLQVPRFDDPLTHKLYGTFLSYLEPDDFAYDLQQRCDPRGRLAEFVKQASFGQIFVSRTVPGITRGNHFHDVKTEKFLVLEGDALIRFRSVLDDEVIVYPVSGKDFRVVDIPPGYIHSIENVGEGELVTLFWASEIFDPERPDTVWEDVGKSKV